MLGESPPQTAWERATPEQRAAALERDQQYERRHAALLADFRAKKIDAETYMRRDMEMVGEMFSQG